MRSTLSFVILAFIDEPGHRSRVAAASDHFIMSAAIVRAENLVAVSDFLANPTRAR